MSAQVGATSVGRASLSMVRDFFVRLRRLDAATLVVSLTVLLIGIPSVLIFQPLGAAGTPANMLGMLMLLWWIAARMVPELGVAAKWQPIRFALALFAIAVLLSYVAAMLHGWGMPTGLQEKTAYGSGTLQPDAIAQVHLKEINAADRGLLSVAAWAGIALAAADGLKTWRQIDRVLKALVFMGTFMALLGMMQYFFGFDVAAYFKIPGLTPNGDFGGIALRSVRRVEATAIHPIEYGVVLATILPIALNRALYARPGHKRAPWASVVIIAAALPMSVSRSAILALGIVVAVMFAGWSGRRRAGAVVVGCMFLVAMKVLVHGLLGTVRSLFLNLGNDPSIKGRTEDYSIVLRLFHEHPWFGRGFFTFIPSLYRTFDNEYLLATVEIGLVGVIALVLLFTFGFFTARGARRATADPQRRDLGQALAASIAGIGVAALTFDMLSFPMAAALLFLLLGCTGALWRLHRDEAARNGVVLSNRTVDATRVPARSDAQLLPLDSDK